MLGFGGILGGVTGGVITQYGSTYLIFYIFGALGFFIALSGFLMSSDIEADHMSVINMSLGERVK